MKKIMILGATLTQIPLIKAAKELGFWTIVASIDGNYPAFEYADEICYVDILNAQAVLQRAQELKIDGIATCCMDTPVKALGLVCDQMKLTGLSFDVANLCNNKLLMKKAFINHNVNTARFMEITNERDLNEACDTLNFPLIIKAVDLQASRGIYVVNNREEAHSGFKKTMALTHQKYCIIEEFIKGEEFGAQAFVTNGEILFVLPHGDYTFYKHTALPIGHFAPLELPEEVIKLAEKESIKAIRAVGLDNCAVNIDMIYKDGKVYMIELTGRAGATNLCELVSIYYGVEYYKMIALAAMGKDPRFYFNKRNKNVTPVATKFLMSNKTGVLKSVINSNTDLDIENICDIEVYVKPGEKVNKFEDGKDRVGHLIVKGASIEECLKTLDRCYSNIKINIE